MAVNNVTIDFNRLEVFHPAERSMQMVYAYFNAYPTAALLYRTALGGSLDGAAQMKEWADNFIHGSVGFNPHMLSGAGHYEWPVEFDELEGTVNGPGVNAISNTPVQAHTKARIGLNKKYTPIALPEDEWAMAMSLGGKAAGVKAGQLMTKYFGIALKTQLKEITTNIFSTNVDEDQGVLSLKAGIGTSATDTTTYANISRSSITAWRGNYSTGTAANWIVATSADFAWTRLGTIIDNLLSNGSRLEDLVIISGATGYQSFRRTLQGTITTAPTAPIGNYNLESGRGIPYTNLYYAGVVPFIYDPNAGTLDVFVIDTATTKIIGLNGSMFKLEDWRISEESTKVWSRLRTISNLVVMSPRNNHYHLLS